MTRFLSTIAVMALISLPACASPPPDAAKQAQAAQRKCPCATLDADELNVIGADAIAKRTEHAQAAQVYDAIIRDMQSQIAPTSAQADHSPSRPSK